MDEYQERVMIMSIDLDIAKERLAYCLDCSLATVEHLCLLKRPSKSELKRQVAISQKVAATVLMIKIDYSRTRYQEVMDCCQGSVERWALMMRNKWHGEQNDSL